MTSQSPATVVVVEDSPTDFAILERAIGSTSSPPTLVHFRTAEAALDALMGTSMLPPPCLVLLDLNLPGMSGLELLRCFNDRAPTRSPVVVVSGSAHEGDVASANRLGAEAFVVKPFGRREALDVAQSLSRYWVDPVAGVE